MFLAQVDTAIDIFGRKCPDKIGVFMFDNAPSHRKFPEDGLNAAAMNVKPGGKQLVMRTQFGMARSRNDTSRWDTKGLEMRVTGETHYFFVLLSLIFFCKIVWIFERFTQKMSICR